MLLTLLRIYYTPGIFVKCTSLNNAVIITLGSTYNEHLATTSRFLCIKIIDCNVKKFGYNQHPLIASSFDYVFLLVVSRTKFMPVSTRRNPVSIGCVICSGPILFYFLCSLW